MNKVPEERAEAMASELARAKPMRRGSLSERYVRCNKPGCACREKPEARHGPYFSVTRAISGRTKSFWVSVEKAEMARKQVEAGKDFRRRIEEFWGACEAWADAELKAEQAASPEAVEKRGFGKRSKRKSPAKSTR